MKKFALMLLLAVSTFPLFAQQKEAKKKPGPVENVYDVQAACGQCQLGLKGKGCTLAIRMDGKAYFVEGTDIDSQGDAHAGDGFCNRIRKAKVQGKVVNGRFKATYFQVLPEEEKKQSE